VTWFNSHSSNKSTPPKSTSPPALSNNISGDKALELDRSHTPEPEHSLHLAEEEVIASGWGGNGDDGDGMRML
jgi:RNA-binding protein 26